MSGHYCVIFSGKKKFGLLGWGNRAASLVCLGLTIVQIGDLDLLAHGDWRRLGLHGVQCCCCTIVLQIVDPLRFVYKQWAPTRMGGNI